MRTAAGGSGLILPTFFLMDSTEALQHDLFGFVGIVRHMPKHAGIMTLSRAVFKQRQSRVPFPRRSPPISCFRDAA